MSKKRKKNIPPQSYQIGLKNLSPRSSVCTYQAQDRVDILAVGLTSCTKLGKSK